MSEKFYNLWTTSAKEVAGMSGGPIIDEATGAVIGVIHGHRKLFNTNLCVPTNSQMVDIIVQNAIW